MKKTRYKIILKGELIGEASSMDAVAELVGCTKQHIYQRLENGIFTFKKITYEIVDKLD